MPSRQLPEEDNHAAWKEDLKEMIKLMKTKGFLPFNLIMPLIVFDESFHYISTFFHKNNKIIRRIRCNDNSLKI